jgi:hypothetical protein
MNTDELRKLAEAVRYIATNGWLDDDDLVDIHPIFAAFISSASPAAVLALLDRIADLERMKMNECDAGFCRSYEAERDELRKLAEAVIAARCALVGHVCTYEEGFAWCQSPLHDEMIEANDNFKNAASPAAVLSLLDERDEARAAAKRLAGALVNMLDDGDRMDKIAASEAMADPVVKRIVEE